MQYFETAYPKVVKLKKSSDDLVTVTDCVGRVTYILDHDTFSAMYQPVHQSVLAERVITALHTVDFEDYQHAVAWRGANTIWIRGLFVVVLLYCGFAMLLGINTPKLQRTLRTVFRIAGLHGVSVGKIVSDDPAMEDTDE